MREAEFVVSVSLSSFFQKYEGEDLCFEQIFRKTPCSTNWDLILMEPTVLNNLYPEGRQGKFPSALVINLLKPGFPGLVT